MVENLHHLLAGISTAIQPGNFLIAMVGLVLGVIVGVLPGLGGANGVAILIPLTVTALILTIAYNPQFALLMSLSLTLAMIVTLGGKLSDLLVAMGAKDAQTVNAFKEADSYPGTSVIVAYSHCIAHGYDMADAVAQQERAVDSAYWPLFRYDPRRAEKGESPLKMDSSAPKLSLAEFMAHETRFRMVEQTNPEQYKKLVAEAERALGARATAHAGVRLDHYARYGSAWSPSLSLSGWVRPRLRRVRPPVRSPVLRVRVQDEQQLERLPLGRARVDRHREPRRHHARRPVRDLDPRRRRRARGARRGGPAAGERSAPRQQHERRDRVALHRQHLVDGAGVDSPVRRFHQRFAHVLRCEPGNDRLHGARRGNGYEPGTRPQRAHRGQMRRAAGAQRRRPAGVGGIGNVDDVLAGFEEPVEVVECDQPDCHRAALRLAARRDHERQRDECCARNDRVPAWHVRRPPGFPGAHYGRRRHCLCYSGRACFASAA